MQKGVKVVQTPKGDNFEDFLTEINILKYWGNFRTSLSPFQLKGFLEFEWHVSYLCIHFPFMSEEADMEHFVLSEEGPVKLY